MALKTLNLTVLAVVSYCLVGDQAHGECKCGLICGGTPCLYDVTATKPHFGMIGRDLLSAHHPKCMDCRWQVDFQHNHMPIPTTRPKQGIVHLNFCIFRGESTAFVERETICTMPEGYRPSTVIAAAVGGDGKSFGNGLPAAELHIEPDGQMWFCGADTRINWVYGEITYLAG